jgi:hemolysin III
LDWPNANLEVIGVADPETPIRRRKAFPHAKMRPMTGRSQSSGEEIANSVSHGIALLAAIGGLPFLIASARHNGVPTLVGATVFSATTALLYLTSTLYHATPVGRLKRIFLKLDYGAIYLFIAGTYTPFALGSTMSSWG